ncbi:Nuclear transport factor 2 (NTF2) domain [Nesidiocoris tenuis]|uniref:NTF2-related export protein n=1 Tax=Nesidiocoris tenuis TaxID=355587 RepID=A0ABN7B894_9HEMI|nr:Nuclear transport factor 2 (NTF2) domain [Nesidiocoris tenuis]
MLDQEQKTQIDMACRTAEEFTKHYYENIDKRRQLMVKFYMDTAVLVWNGNGIIGKDEISKFLTALPLTEHKVGALDAQRILDTAVGGKLAFLITVAGTVKFSSKNHRPFTQNFMITNHEDKWKIVSDCFRCQDPL